MHDISLVIFDCDGVLIDSEYLSATVLIEVFADIGAKIDLEFVYDNFVGHSFPNVAALHAKKYGSNVPETFEADYRNTLLNRFVGRLLPIAGIETVLAQLAVPYWIMARALKHIPPFEAGLLTLLEPVLNPLWAYLVSPATEVPTMATLIGGGVILTALAWRYMPFGEPPTTQVVPSTSAIE